MLGVYVTSFTLSILIFLLLLLLLFFFFIFLLVSKDFLWGTCKGGPPPNNVCNM